MESNKQERYNLISDNPIAKTASGDRSFMSKHASQSRMGSPLEKADETGMHDTDESFVEAVAAESAEEEVNPFAKPGTAKPGGAR